MPQLRVPDWTNEFFIFAAMDSFGHVTKDTSAGVSPEELLLLISMLAF